MGRPLGLGVRVTEGAAYMLVFLLWRRSFRLGMEYDLSEYSDGKRGLKVYEGLSIIVYIRYNFSWANS